MEKNCINCGRRIVGRTDKKFCTDGCRYTHHNHLNINVNNSSRRILYAARKNKLILEQALSCGNGSITKPELEAMGFNFQAVTGLQDTENGHRAILVFEMVLEDIRGRYQIRRNPT